MKLIFCLTTFLFLEACNTNKQSDLEKENAELKLKKENIELKTQLEALETNKEGIKNAALMNEYIYWRDREAKEERELITRSEIELENIKAKKAQGQKLSQYEEIMLATGKTSLQYSKDALRMIMDDEFYNRWYEERERGIDLKL